MHLAGTASATWAESVEDTHAHHLRDRLAKKHECNTIITNCQRMLQIGVELKGSETRAIGSGLLKGHPVREIPARGSERSGVRKATQT